MAETISISLNDVTFFSKIGVFEQERLVGNEFKVNLSVEIPVTSAMRDDRLDGTISYADLCAEIREIMTLPAMTLEYVALTIAERVKQRWPFIIAGSVTLTKVAPPITGIMGSASVTHRF